MLDRSHTIDGVIPHPNDVPLDQRHTILYHARCTDGFAAAYCFWKKLGDRAEYIPVSHNSSFPRDLPRHSWVWILDFSYDKRSIPEDRFRRIITLDHHISAMDNSRCSSWRNIVDKSKAVGVHGKLVVYIDTNRSGVGIAWDYWNDSPMPTALLAIQDRDLWTWDYKLSEEICLAIDSYKMDFEEWDKIIDSPGDLASRGKILIAYKDSLVNRALSQVSWKKITWFNYSETSLSTIPNTEVVPVVNCIQLPSEVGNRLCQENPKASFSVTWYETSRNRVKISFRSIGETDVSRVARSLGGGGHRNASGATITKEQAKELLSEPTWWEVEKVKGECTGSE